MNIFSKDEVIDEIAIASTIIVEEFKSRSALLLTGNSVNSYFNLERRFSILTFSRYFFRISTFFEKNPFELISKLRRFKIYLFRFDEEFDIVATIDLFL